MSFPNDQIQQDFVLFYFSDLIDRSTINLRLRSRIKALACFPYFADGGRLRERQQAASAQGSTCRTHSLKPLDRPASNEAFRTLSSRSTAVQFLKHIRRDRSGFASKSTRSASRLRDPAKCSRDRPHKSNDARRVARPNGRCFQAAQWS